MAASQGAPGLGAADIWYPTVGRARLCSPYFCAYGGNGGDREAATGANGLPPDSFESRAGCAATDRVRWLWSCGAEALYEPVR